MKFTSPFTKCVLPFLFLATAWQATFSQSFKTQSISVFKNGLAFVQKKASLKTSGQQATLFSIGGSSDTTLGLQEQLGALKFGSLWFRSPGNELHSVSRYAKRQQRSIPVQSLPELLRSNIGKPATFRFRDVHAAQDPAIRKDPVRIAADTWTLEGDFLVLHADGKWSNALLRDLEGVDFNDKPNLHRSVDEDQLGLHLQFTSSKSRQEVELMYVREGIYWVPTYHLDIQPGGKARLRLVANLLNDVEDIEDCHMDFVVGTPNFEFRDIPTPMGSEASVAEFMQQLAGQRQAAGLGRQPVFDLGSAAFSNSISYNYSQQDATQTQRFIVQPESDLEDGMFVYSKDNVSLRKGGRALIDLFEATLPAEKVYHADLPRNPIGPVNAPSTRQEVIQSYKLQNTSGCPLTHGPVFVTSSQSGDLRPLANDKILFTPAGLPAYVKVADASDVLLYAEEKESTGQLQGLVGWRKLSMESTISLTNMREEPVTVEVTRIIEGEPDKCSSDWKLEVLRKKLRKRNQLNLVTWRVELPAQHSKTIRYGYTVHNYD